MMPAPAMLPLLVIEDEASVQAFLRTALERNGFSIVMANSGADGLRILQADDQEFAGVISDMRTPGGVTGADVHSWLKQNRPDLAGKLLFITGDIVNEETSQILHSTGVPCIEKPFRVVELLGAINKVMGL